MGAMPTPSFYQYSNQAMLFTCAYCHAVSAVLRLNGTPKDVPCPCCGAVYTVSVVQTHPPVNLKAKLQGDRIEAAG